MRSGIKRLLLTASLVAVPTGVQAANAKLCPPALAADEPVVATSMEQVDIDSGMHDLGDISQHGARLFAAKFNVCDGAGRPRATGGGDRRNVPTVSDEGHPISRNQIVKLRTSAPDADACAGCHNDPVPGGAGDFVANVFVLAQTLDPVTLSVTPALSNSRNTLGMHGAGPIEMLAREMTAELQAQADGLPDGRHVLTTKGVSFEIEIRNGEVVHSEGIDHDLVVRPFHQSGKVVSLREFSVNAMNHHHGMQAEERFDLSVRTGFDSDHDGDGVQRELTIGDMTAISIWQAQLSTPGQVLPASRDERQSAARGQAAFDDIGCSHCHKPEMTLNQRFFVEPNPYNPAGTCARVADGCPDFAFDMTRQGEGNRLAMGPNGTALVRPFTDLKRHNLCDPPGPDAIRWFCNEQLAQGRPDQSGNPGSEYFLTRKLWDVGNTAPYGHRGDISTITEAILYHGGEARRARDAFEAMPARDQRALVTFLKTLRVVPEHPFGPGTPPRPGRGHTDTATARSR